MREMIKENLKGKFVGTGFSTSWHVGVSRIIKAFIYLKGAFARISSCFHGSSSVFFVSLFICLSVVLLCLSLELYALRQLPCIAVMM